MGHCPDYQFVFEMDADFSHNPNDLPRLYHACKNDGADLAVGSRYVKSGGVVNWPRTASLYRKGVIVHKNNNLDTCQRPYSRLYLL